MKERKTRAKKRDLLVMFLLAMVITYLSFYVYSQLTKPKTFDLTNIGDLASVDSDGYIYPDEVDIESGEYQYDLDAANHFMLAWAEAVKNKDYNLYFSLLSKSTKIVIIAENFPEIINSEPDPVQAYMNNPAKYNSQVKNYVKGIFEDMGTVSITSFKVLSIKRIECTEEDKKEGIEGYLNVVVLKEYDDGTGEETSTQLIIENNQLKL